MLANLMHALSGQEFGERTPYKMEADVSVKQGGSGAGNIPPSLKTVAQTAAMEDAYPKQDYGYDYPTYEPKPTITAPAPVSDPYAYLFQGQGRPASVEKYIPTGGTTAATGMTYGQSNQPTFEQFLALQKQMEAQMGLQPMSEQEYLNMYQAQMQRTR